MALDIYLPQDRLRALANNRTLPDRTTGVALFADISGFTALTEGLRDALGPRRQLTVSLHLFQEMGAQFQMTSTLVGMALLSVYEGHPRRSAQLLGAIEAALQTLAAAREGLGDAVFQSAWEEGSHWSLEEAVKRALE